MTAKCEGILMAKSESRLEVESSLVEQKLQAHSHADIGIARTSDRGRREVSLRALNALLTHCEQRTLVTPQCNVRNPGITQSVEKYQEVPKKETRDMQVGRLRKRRRDRTLAALRRQKAKGRSQSRCESTKRVTVAGKTTYRRANVAWLMRETGRGECTGDNVASSNQRRRTCKKGLDILRAYGASVGIGRQTLRLAEEEVSLWSPGAAPRSSSLIVEEQVIPAECEGTVMARLERPLGIENGLVERRPAGLSA
jgi:hypothetical protein